MIQWEKALCLAHLVLHILVHELEANGLGDLYDRMSQILKVIENDDDEMEEMLEGADAIDDDNVLVVESGALACLFDAAGIDQNCSAQATSAYEEHTICFRMLLYFNPIAEVLDELSAYPGVETEVSKRIEELRSDPECEELCPYWVDFSTLGKQIREESAFQWFMAADLVCCTHPLESQVLVSLETIRSTIETAIAARTENEFASIATITEIRDLILPRLSQLVELCTSGDDGQPAEMELNLSDAHGDSLTAEAILTELQIAVKALEHSPCS